MNASPRDLLLIAKAKRHGARYSLRIIIEARRAGIPISAGFTLVEKETNFRNVFGHDPTKSIPRAWMGTEVTRDKYAIYKNNRRDGKGMQGVGPTQLTWWEFQDRADKLGGCWNPKHNIRVGIDIFASYYKANKRQGKSTEESVRLAGQRFNGSGAAAERYGWDFLHRYKKWHQRLGG